MFTRQNNSILAPHISDIWIIHKCPSRWNIIYVCTL